MAANKFLQWRTTATNPMQNDTAYAADTIRETGAKTGDICDPEMDNKFRHQMSIFISAFGDMMVAKGYDMSDASKSDLIVELAHIITEAEGAIDYTASSGKLFLTNKPTIPAAQVQTDFNATTGMGVLLNKATLLSLITAAGIPTGGVIPYPSSTTIPAGFLECDGSAISQTTYSALYTAIGSSVYGTGVGTFRLPDYRGRFLRGRDFSAGRDPDKATRVDANIPPNVVGDVVGSIQADAFKSHTHGIDNEALFHSSPGINNNARPSNGAYSIGSTGGAETRPINISVAWIIRTGL